jgi:hypothetical protein
MAQILTIEKCKNILMLKISFAVWWWSLVVSGTEQKIATLPFFHECRKRQLNN